MALTARIKLKRGRYAANGLEQPIEEVPSPFRLFASLVSVAARTGDPRQNQALRWLEAQNPPEIIHPPVLDRGQDKVFLVANRINAKGGSVTHPGRVNASRGNDSAWVTYEGDELAFVWADSPNDEVMSGLVQLANGVTYFGRVESTASVCFSADPVEWSGARRWKQVPIGRGELSTAAPYRGLVDALVDAHEAGEPAWHAARSVDYAEDRPEPASNPIALYQSILTFGIVGQKPSGQFCLELANCLRSAVYDRAQAVVGEGSDVPDAIHGHNNDIGHLAYLPLLNVGAEHSDGQILGVGIAIPADIDPAAQQVLLGAVRDPANPFDRLTYGRAEGRELELVAGDAMTGRPWTVSPRRWRGSGEGALTWATATPMMLDRYPAKDDVETEVAASVVRAGYPPPVWVKASSTSLIPGGIRYGPGWQRAIGSRPKRPLVHAQIRFGEPVVGPVTVGSLRFLGGGLCAPIDTPVDSEQLEQPEAEKSTEVGDR